MPRFEVIIEPPPYVRDLNSCEQVTVKARLEKESIMYLTIFLRLATHLTSTLTSRYTFGKPVTGKLTVNMTVNGVGYYRHEVGHPVTKSMEVRE